MLPRAESRPLAPLTASIEAYLSRPTPLPKCLNRRTAYEPSALRRPPSTAREHAAASAELPEPRGLPPVPSRPSIARRRRRRLSTVTAWATATARPRRAAQRLQPVPAKPPAPSPSPDRAPRYAGASRRTAAAASSCCCLRRAPYGPLSLSISLPLSPLFFPHFCVILHFFFRILAPSPELRRRAARRRLDAGDLAGEDDRSTVKC